MNEEQLKEFRQTLEDIKAGRADITKALDTIQGEHKTFGDRLKGLEDENGSLKKALETVRRQNARLRIIQPRKAGEVSEECAKYLTALVICGAAVAEKKVNDQVHKWAVRHIDEEVSLCEREPNFDALDAYRKAVTAGPNGTQQRAALTTSEIPLPVGYAGEVVSLVEMYGSFRRYATVFPMGEGTLNLPKLSTDPAFGFIDISGSVGEKAPAVAFVEFAAKKAGGIVRIPSEIDQDSVVALGRFIADYIARQMASWEDTVGWKADGSGTYKTLEGVTDRVSDNSKLVTLTSGETATDDVALADLRLLRGVPNSAVLESGNAAYYLHPTMEALLASFNTGGSVHYIRNPDGTAILDGFPVRWVNKLSPYSASAVVSTVVALFGDMRYWYLGDRGSLRIDISRDVYFATDEVGVRALKRFTVEEMAVDAMAGIKTAAS